MTAPKHNLPPRIRTGAPALILALCAPALAGEVALSSLDLSKTAQGWGSPQVDRSVRGQPLAIAGQKFEKGVGTHAPMSLFIRLNSAQRFRADVGIDDSSGSTNEGSVVFQVFGDGRLLFSSPVMKPGDRSVPVDVALAGIRLMQLEVTDAGDGFRFDHADWANSRFETTGARPETVSPMDFGPAKLALAGQGVRQARAVALPFQVVLPEPVTNYVAVTAGSDFRREYLLNARLLDGTGFLFEQRAGRSCAGLKPWIMLRSLVTGKGLSAMLAYSGNWKIEIKPEGTRTVLRMDAVPPGLEPFKTVADLPLPGAIVADFAGEWDNGALPITRFIRAHLARKHPGQWPLVQWNTWYDDLGFPTEQSVLEGAKVAAEMGCEMVTLDAGWYGGKGHWEDLCGDWMSNRERFPNGLEPVIRQVRQLGMKFGLWIEIESASRDSPVAKEHPDWLLRDGNRLASGRSVLDFGKPAVVAWAKAVIDRLMRNYQLDYLKDDFNTDLSVNSAAPNYAAGDPLYRHYRGLNDFWSHVFQTYPNLIVENCSSGSLRHEAMTASQSDTHWISDEVGNNYNLGAVFGATYLFPPETCLHWTCYPDARPELPMDLEAQIAANMMGHLGFSTKIAKWDEETRRTCARQVACYKQIRQLICRADVYHLTPQASLNQPSSFEAALYLEPKEGRGVLFAFQGGAQSLECRLVLRGLAADRQYRVELPEGYGAAREVPGRELMRSGLNLAFPHRGASAIITITALPRAGSSASRRAPPPSLSSSSSARHPCAFAPTTSFPVVSCARLWASTAANSALPTSEARAEPASRRNFS